MIWYIAEDKLYYELSKDIKAFGEKVGNNKIEKISVIPSREDIKNILIDDSYIVVLSPEYPPIEFNNVFILQRLQNAHGVLTTQEKIENVSIARSLEVRFGLLTYYSSYSFKDLGGAKTFKKWADRLELSKAKGHAIKPVFLLGVPGVGKSYAVACYAGEKNIPLMELNVSLILESREPIKMLNRAFSFLSTNETECVLLIDEIEHMLSNKAMFGEFLTILNNLNLKNGYKLNGMLFATSNNISEVALNFPQFLRHGRWSEKFFANYPTKEEAIDIIKLYASIFGINSIIKGFKDLDEFADYVFIMSNQYYKNSNIDEKRSVYAPSEISYLFEKLTFYDSVGKDELEQEIKSVEPLQKTTHEGIHKIIQDSKSNAFKEM